MGLCLRKSPHDDKLSWPMKGEFEIALLNQISDSEHHGESIYYNMVMTIAVTESQS